MRFCFLNRIGGNGFRKNRNAAILNRIGGNGFRKNRNAAILNRIGGNGAIFSNASKNLNFLWRLHEA
jgi:hypothetical protein